MVNMYGVFTIRVGCPLISTASYSRMEFWHAAAIAAFVVAFLWFNENLGKTEVTEWLEEQGKGHLAKELEEAGSYRLLG